MTMMQEIFLTVLQQTFVGSLIVLGLVLIRLLLTQAKKGWVYPFWILLVVRLLVPGSISSVFSLLPINPENFRLGLANTYAPLMETGIPVINKAVNPLLPMGELTASVDTMQVWLTVGGWIWLVGAAFFMGREVAAAIHLKRQIRRNTRIRQGRVYEVEGLQSSFVMGIIHPKIYLPAGLEEEQKQLILAHEQVHIQRQDCLWKSIAFLLLCLHWFNPLMWIAFALFCRDMEMSCDETTTKPFDVAKKKAYAQLLLEQAVCHRWPARQTPFSNHETKKRIHRLLVHKAVSVWQAGLLMTAGILLGAGLFLDPPMERNSQLVVNVAGDVSVKQENAEAVVEFTPENHEQPAVTIHLQLPTETRVSELAFGAASIYKGNPLQAGCSLQFGKASSIDGIYKITEKQCLEQPNEQWELFYATGYWRVVGDDEGISVKLPQKVIYGINDTTGYAFWFNFPQAISIKASYDREESIARQEAFAQEIAKGITME